MQKNKEKREEKKREKRKEKSMNAIGGAEDRMENTGIIVSPLLGFTAQLHFLQKNHSVMHLYFVNKT